MMMLNEREVNRLNTLFGGRTEDVDAVFELCENDEVLKDKVETLAYRLGDIEDLVYDIHDYIHDLKIKAIVASKPADTPIPVVRFDNRTSWGFAMNRNGNVCPHCHGEYMRGSYTCGSCGRTL